MIKCHWLKCTELCVYMYLMIIPAMVMVGTKIHRNPTLNFELTAKFWSRCNGCNYSSGGRDHSGDFPLTLAFRCTSPITSCSSFSNLRHKSQGRKFIFNNGFSISMYNLTLDTLGVSQLSLPKIHSLSLHKFSFYSKEGGRKSILTDATICKLILCTFCV